MNVHLLLSLLLASLKLELTHIRGVTALTEDYLLPDLSNRHLYRDFYPDLMQKIRYLCNSGLDDFQTNCSQELLQFWEDLDNKSQAAYLDSFGKVGAGILTGNVAYLGYYDQCIDIGNTDYCRFPFEVTLTTTTVSSAASVTIPVEIGMCFPSSCNAMDFYNLFSNVAFYSKSVIDINAITYAVNVMASMEYTAVLCPWRDLRWTNSSIAVLTVCVLLIVLVIIGTTVDASLWLIGDVLPKLHLPETEPQKAVTYPTTCNCEVKHSINEDEPHAKHKPKTSQTVTEKHFVEFIKDLMLSFSLYRTIPAIMATHQPASAVTSINGIRVISMFWIILGHTFALGNLHPHYGFKNIQEISETVYKHFFFQVVSNIDFAVDSFFVLSGVLLSYLSIKEIDRHQGKFPFLSFYVHRLLRLSPAYYLSVFLQFKVLPHVGSGPLWFVDDVSNCEKYWFTNILYINNFYPTLMFNSCHIPTWYLANVMQFFIISPVFLLLLHHCWKIGFATIGGTMLASIAIIGILAGIKNLNANLLQGDMLTNMSIIYEKPYCRINAYFIGILLGFVLYKEWKVRSNLWILVCFYSLMWIIAISCCLTIVFGQYKTWNGHPFTKAENIMYLMFSRTVYSTGVALMIYSCHNGFGGAINKFLSCSFWVPLSHLNFTAYLFHAMVITLMYRTMRFQFIYTDWLLIILFAATVVLSYSLAFIIAVTLEYPVVNIENAVYKFVGLKRRK